MSNYADNFSLCYSSFNHALPYRLMHYDRLQSCASLRLNSTIRARPDPRGLCRRPARTNGVSRRSGSCGSGRARVVEFSYYRISSCAAADGPRDALCQSESRQLLHNSCANKLSSKSITIGSNGVVGLQSTNV